MRTPNAPSSRRVFEWSTVGKSQFLFFFSCGLMSLNLSVLQLMSAWYPFARHLNTEHTQQCLHAGLVYCIAALLLGAMGWLFKDRKRGIAAHIFSNAALNMYNLGGVFTLFMYGMLTMIMGIFFSGGLILGLILLGHRKTTYAVSFLIMASCVMFYLYQTGQIQYAYVFRSEADTHNNLTWLTLIMANSLPHIICLLYFASESTDAWREREENVIKLSLTDPLTQCYNRRFLIDKAQEKLDHSIQSNQSISIMMVDIDHFKQVNDTYGHHIGDLAIQYVANTLKENIRRIDIVSRYGGEEFCILMSNCNQDTAKLISERCRIQIQYNPLPLEDQPLSLTASFGVITVSGQEISEQELTAYDLLSCADKALYQAKKSGRNKCVTVSINDDLS